jgi:toxin ParE1/3/4
MARLELAPEALADLDRILDYIVEQGVPDAALRLGQLIDAISILEQNPLIGRLAEKGQRELVTGRRSQGYVALYRYVAEIDMVFVLGIRSQREAGHSRN